MRRLCYLFILALAFSACKKDKGTNAFKGSYEGTFRTIVNQKMVMSESKVLFSDDQYYSMKGRGSGKFSLQGNSIVRFEDKNIWTADFDWGLILNGDYQYKTKGDSLILTKILPALPYANTVYNYYQYRLKRTR